MARAAAILSLLFSLSTALIGAVWVMVYRLTPERDRSKNLHWLLWWSLRGLVVPLALWAIINVGISWNLQPFMPQVQAAQNSGKGWLLEFVRVLVAGLFIISSSWAAGTLGWVLARAGAELTGQARTELNGLCLTCCIGMVLPAAGLVLLGGWPTLGLAATAILAPIAGYAPAILHAKKRPPMYSRAIARTKFGKYAEAEWEIIHELER